MASLGQLIVPPNITLLALAAEMPRTQPAENIWQFMRDNWLSNRIFKSYDDIVDHCCDAWNKLIDHPGASCPSGCEIGPIGHDH